MSYELITERTEQNRLVRTYRNKQGSETKTAHIYTTKDGANWWGFVDLHKIPYLRMAYAKHVTDMFTLGMTQKDLVQWCEQEKVLLKSDDPEKYEKLYAYILEKERIIKQVADPIKQNLALCSVYILSEEERPDYFDQFDAERKLKHWGGDPGAVSFFLNWLNKHIQHSLGRLEKISKTVSILTEKTGLESL